MSKDGAQGHGKKEKHSHEHEQGHVHSHAGCNHDHGGHGHKSAAVPHVHGISDRIGFAFVLNFCFAIIEVIGGLWVNSVAILSDGIHDFGDAVALGLAWYLERKSMKPGDHQYSYGYRRLSTLSAMFTAGLLLAGSIGVLILSVPRLFEPETVHTAGMLWLAVFGLIINGIAAYRISRGRSLNERALTWHLMEDFMGWLLVLVGAGIIYFTQWYWVDALLAILLSLWILTRVWKTLRETVRVFLQRVPSEVSMDELLMSVKKVAHVVDIHHPHLWSMDGEKHIFTAHVIISQSASLEQMAQAKREIKKTLTQFGIVEATLEFEAENEDCVDPHH